jgi:hypothetical protein
MIDIYLTHTFSYQPISQQQRKYLFSFYNFKSLQHTNFFFFFRQDKFFLLQYLT